MQPAPVDQRVYVSVVGVRELMNTLKYPTPEAYEALSEAHDRLEATVQQLEDELADTNHVLDAIDRMESRGFVARNKTGRPPKRVAETEG